MRLLLLVTFLFSAVASAGSTTVIKAARLFDGKSDRLISPGIIVVRDGKIVSVGAKSDLSGASETIDLGDATLSPGFMDAHTHLTMEMSDDWKQDRIDWYEKSIPEKAVDSTVNAKATLWAGFTTCRDVGSSD